jgi:RNA ligase
MDYQFPTITHIDQVLSAIEGAPEFIHVVKDGYQIINYVVAGSETFPEVKDDYCPGCKEFKTEIGDCGSQRCPDFISASAIRRECRGLVFDMDGLLIGRRYHKFFNVNERDETSIGKIDWSKPHVILEKLDGSMVSPCFVNGHLRWMTKMGITDTSMEAEVFVASRPDYVEFAENYLTFGFTPIFEWCSNKNRIVLDYPEDRLVLTAMRCNETGNYLLYDALVHTSKRYGIPVVKVWDVLRKQDTELLMDIVRQSEDAEGVVVRFDDGQMCKIKSDWYVRIHKVKSLLGQERDVVSLILKNELDDLLPVLPEDDVLKIQKFKNELELVIAIDAFNVWRTVQDFVASVDRKTFALEYGPNMDPMWRGLIFQFWDKEVNERLTYQAIVDIIIKNCGSNASYAKVKEAFLKEIDYV